MPQAVSRDLPTQVSHLDMLVGEHVNHRLPRYERLWRYYRNPVTKMGASSANGRGYELAQEQGLPARLTLATGGDGSPRERVIENDIAWRVHTLVDFMFGKSVLVQSLAEGASRAELLETFLRAVFEHNGGVSFFQDLALLGSVYGFVDVMVHVSPSAAAAGDPLEVAKCVTLEIVEAPRAVPVVDASDFRRLQAYVLHVQQPTGEFEAGPLLSRVRDRVLRGRPGAKRAVVEQTQVWTAEVHQRYRRNRSGFGAGQRLLVESQVNALGRIPVVHIQNLPQPFFYDGLSEVEPLIPLQDELNTRLSDRANRVTFQSFKMYLGKGIEGFTERPVGPGQMWSTDNPDASIETFGGDGANPSEEAHIAEIRDAMDKTSGVTPVAAGQIRGKVGNLTSENALRIVLMGLLAKTEKKRVTYGAGLERLCELMLHAVDVHGLLPNEPEERRIRLDWPNPVPDSETQRLQNAALKVELGVPRKQVLAELGYGDCVA